MKIVPLPIPTLGLNTVDPTIAFNSGYARELTNVYLSNAKVKQRPSSRLKYSHSSLTNYANWFDVDSGTPYSIETTAGLIRNVSTGASSTNIGGDCQGPATMFKHHSISVLCGCREPRSPLGPTFTSHGFALSVITNEATITAGTSHRGRPYFTNGDVIEYGDIGQVTGAFATDGLAGGDFDPSPLMGGQTILRLFSVTIQQGNQSDNVFVIFGSGGKVLVYSGDWPDADNWAIVGDYNMPMPSSITSFLEIDGDIMVGTPRYCYWFRMLFTDGPVSAYENRLSKPIENLWQAQRWAPNGSTATKRQAHIFYVGNLVDSNGDQENIDAIFFQSYDGISDTNLPLTGIADYETQAVYFVYLRQYKAWALWLMTAFYAPTREVSGNPNAIQALGISGEVKTLVAGNFADQLLVAGATTTVEVEGTWKTPYAAPFDGKNQHVKGIRPFFKNSLSGYLPRIRCIYDFSDYNSAYAFATQSTVTEIIPSKKGDASLDIAANTYGVYNALMNPGGIGGGVSFEFNFKRKPGTTQNQTLEIMGGSVLIADGGILF